MALKNSLEEHEIDQIEEDLKFMEAEYKCCSSILDNEEPV